MIPDGEVGCKICDKSIYRIFVEHIQGHLESNKKTNPLDCGRNVMDVKVDKKSITYCCDKHKQELYEEFCKKEGTNL